MGVRPYDLQLGVQVKHFATKWQNESKKNSARNASTLS